ncbi:hypothetical protein [Streptomyces mirabilis]|uniref:hypothetical protein n=1 Tax=Streptomyces mirabilis TaxID=68239 RepID=UPI0036B7AF00
MKGPELSSLRPRRLATIRGRILIGVLVLLAAGLIGNSVAGAVTLRDYLDHRAEVSLRASGDRVHRLLAAGPQTINGTQLSALISPILGMTVIGPDGGASEIAEALALAQPTCVAPTQTLTVGPGVRSHRPVAVPSERGRVTFRSAVSSYC